MITLYHGSNVVIDKIDLSYSKSGKDFGKGFYLNPSFQQANNMAVRVARQRMEGEPFVTSFIFDEKFLSSDSGLSIKCFDDYSEEWLNFILMNRKVSDDQPAHNYDIVVGPIANDTVGVSISLYLSGFATIEQTINRLRFQGSRAIQYFFGTEKAVSLLTKQEL